MRVPVGLVLLGTAVGLAGPEHLAAQVPAPLELTLARGPTEVSHPAGSAGHHAVFTLTHTGSDTVTYVLDCVGLGRVRCAGMKHPSVTLTPGQRFEVVAFYEAASGGRGLLLLVASDVARARRATATLRVWVEP